MVMVMVSDTDKKLSLPAIVKVIEQVPARSATTTIPFTLQMRRDA